MYECDRTCLVILFVFLCAASSRGQREPGFPLTRDSFRMVLRFKTAVPPGRLMKTSDIKVLHYTTDLKNPKSYSTKQAAKRILADPGFDISKPTVVYAHGYLELSTDESVSTIASAYIAAGGHNLLVLDYSNLVYGDYLSAVLHLPPIGVEAARVAWGLVRGGVPPARLHLVGHSLGAHVAALLARNLAARGVRIPRISGLDPAYPLFYKPLQLHAPLAAADADFVDIIHTDGGSYGSPTAAGHADFWPNGGIATQPGCDAGPLLWTYEDFCSHWRSWAFWAESVSGAEFRAVPCRRLDHFTRGACTQRGAGYMGERANHTMRGNFYLRTAAKSPYALGERGIN